MEPIGGYFSLELPLYEEYHKDAIRLNTGRNCLEYILRVHNYNKVYIPYYTCEVILEPLAKLCVPYEFYHVNINLEIEQDIELNRGETILYTNYYGLKQNYIETLAAKYGNQLIVDNTQAFYDKPLSGIDTFYTCRKFFGVPDGAYLYIDKFLNEELEQDFSWNRMSFLTKRIEISAEAGYGDFQELSRSLVGQPIKRMSNLTQRLMQSIDYSKISCQRRANYIQLHEALQSSNQQNITLEPQAVPMVYPYMTDRKNLRDVLIQNKVFVAKYWHNVEDWADNNSMETKMVNQLCPLPIDQRYNEEDINRVINIVKEK